ncbi:hypothetical protein N182_30670 [Sinorhizobium sp. GL2]|nr:hypothetical protein N182_30670 [Sinorhizobium sp. GL2]
MRHDVVRVALLLAGSVASGWIGWSGHVLLLPAALAFPVLWSKAPNRATSAAVSAGYFLAASRGLPQGVANFYASDLWPGLLLWLFASLSFVAVHTALWSKHEKWRPIRYLAALVLMAIPPFGIAGWAHPITAAGVLFPGWGWFGLLVTIAGAMALVTCIGPKVAIALGSFWLWSAATWINPYAAKMWHGVDLQMHETLGRDAGLQRQHDLIAAVRTATGDDTRFVVLPESALGFWTPTMERLWRRNLSGSDTVVIAGATVVDAEGYDNVLVAIDRDGGRILYRERMPVPGSMWQPWRPWLGENGGARAYFFANPVAGIGPVRLTPVICYEQLIVWPILQSMLYNPDIIVAVGNGWWTAGTSIVAIQRASATAWARLFSKPLVLSFNT